MQRVRINFAYKRKNLKRGIEPHQQGCKKFKIKTNKQTNKRRDNTKNLRKHS